MPDPRHATFAAAKTFRPRVHRALPRPRLFERLDALHDAAITWIAASPGAGKTTLAASYVAARHLATLWYQLDGDDGDVATFFHYLGRAAAASAGGPQPELPALLPAHLPSRARYTRRYAAGLAACLEGTAVLVLDNYEQIDERSALHEVICELAAALPRRITLLVLSRVDPPPAFARMRVNESLALFDPAALSLTREEAGLLADSRETCAQETGAHDDARVEALRLETRGWLAGFTLLLAQGIGGGAGIRPRSQRLLFDYFASEFFDRFEPAIQQALLRSALLPTMRVADVQRLVAEPAIGAVLADLHRRNCFCAERGDSEPVYEYHALLRSFLLARAEASIAPAEWRALQRRAAALLADGGQPDAAAALYRASSDHNGLAALVLQEAPALIAAGRHRTLEHWLADWPDEAASAVAGAALAESSSGDRPERSPWLHYWRATARLPFDAAQARAIFERAYTGFAAADDAVGLYSTWAGAMESFFYEWRDFRPADRWIDELATLRSRHPAFPSREIELRTYKAMGTLLHRRPDHPDLPTWSERALALLDPAQRDLSVLLGGYLVIYFLWQGRTSEATSVIERVAPWIGPGTSVIVHILWSCAIALDHSVRGRIDACRAAVAGALVLAEHSGLHAFDHLLAAQMARCTLLVGDPAAAEPWLAQMAATMRDRSHIDGAFHRHLKGNAAAQHGDWQSALDHARAALALALASGVPFLTAQCHLDLARALLERGGDAAEHLEQLAAARAIGRAMRSGVVEYLCLEAEAVASIRAEAGDCRDRIGRALAASHAMGGAIWQIAGPRVAARLYDRALVEGIEVDHVRRLVRERRLTPPDAATAAPAWPWPVRVYTLGRFELLCDDAAPPSSGKAQKKPLELLKCLCAFGGEAVSQDRVADALWEGAEGDAADQALRTTLHRLRKLLGDERAVRLEDRQLHLDPNRVWADCLAFDRVAGRAPDASFAELRCVVSGYGGPFLDGEAAPWAHAWRGRLRAQFLRLAEQVGTALERGGDIDGAAQCWLHAIAVEPDAEAPYRHLMAIYAGVGRRSDAIAVYQRCRLTLLTRLGISPAAETQALHRQLAA